MMVVKVVEQQKVDMQRHREATAAVYRWNRTSLSMLEGERRMSTKSCPVVGLY